MSKKNAIIILIAIIVILLLVIAFLLGKNSNNNNINHGVGKAGISFEEFKKIKNGDSENTVFSIIDPDDLLDDEDTYNKVVIETSKSQNNLIYTFTMRYMGENEGYAEITYTADYSNGELYVIPTVTSKNNFNLK